MTYDLDRLKLKTAPELEEGERQFLRQNIDKLNDEDREAYKSFLNDEQPEGEEPAKPEPQEQRLSFKTQEEFDAYLDKKLEERKAKTPETPKEETPPTPQKLFEKPPEDWDDFYKKVEEGVTKKISEMTQKEKAERKERKERARKALKGFQGEYDTLAKEGKVPDRKTDEGKIVWEQIWKVGNDNGKANITESYALWSIIPVEHGGGYDPTPGKTKQKQQLDLQKQAAARLNGKGSESKSQTPPGYIERRNRNLDQAIEQKLM